MTNKIAFGFITYGTSVNFLERLKILSSLKVDIYLFDNTPSKFETRVFCQEIVNVKYLTAGKNLGLGFGLSAICAQAFYEGNDALLFFDQDTIFSVETIKFVEDFYLKNITSFEYYSVITFNSPKKSTVTTNEKFSKVLLTLNSGSLFLLKNLAAIGWHNENYFVDGVDYEFCLNSYINGFNVGLYIDTPGFDHVTEQDDKPYKLFGRRYLWRAYPKFRLIDTIHSSVKLIYKSLLFGQFVFAKKFTNFLFYYVVIQVAVRIFNPVDE